MSIVSIWGGLLVPFHFPGRRGQPIPIPVKPIPMREIHVRQAWEVGDNNPDVMALRPDDDPFIPPKFAFQL